MYNEHLYDVYTCSLKRWRNVHSFYDKSGGKKRMDLWPDWVEDSKRTWQKEKKGWLLISIIITQNVKGLGSRERTSSLNMLYWNYNKLKDNTWTLTSTVRNRCFATDGEAPLPLVLSLCPSAPPFILFSVPEISRFQPSANVWNKLKHIVDLLT